MRIIVAPDKFRGTLTAAEAAEAMASGARAVHPEAELKLRPLADGGDGTLDAFALARGGRIRMVEATDPFGHKRAAPIALLDDGRVVIEMASISGLALIDEQDRRALVASTAGTGDLIHYAAALEGVDEIVVGIGGTASTDGGMGAARVLGWRFLDAAGNELSPGGGSLRDLARIEPPGNVPGGMRIVAACDVDNPLTGARGSARVFGPQKGASPADVEVLEEGLARFAEVIARDVGIEIGALPFGGAGGGAAAGLHAFAGAELLGGFDLFAAATDLERDVAAADLVITGEGRLDAQSLAGKGPIALARMAAAHRVPCVAVAGRVELGARELRRAGIEAAAPASPSGDEDQHDPASRVRRAVRELLRRRLDRARGVRVARRSR